MKLLILLPIFKNTGPSNVVVSMINQLLKFNIDLYLVSFYPAQDNYQTKFAPEQLTFIELTGFNIKSLWRLWCLIRDERIDVLHSHCLLPDLAAPLVSLFNGNKKVATVHCNLKNNYTNEYQFPKGIIYYTLHRIALMFSQTVSVSSSAKITQNTPVIYNGLASQKSPQRYTKENSTTLPLNLVFAGRLIESKNVSFLLKSFVELQSLAVQQKQQVHLHIFGDGPLMKSIKEQQLVNLHLYGFVDNYLTQIPNNSIVVNPSLFEGMPMSVIEAVSCQLPVALSSITAHNEIAQHIHNGVAIFDNTTTGFLQAIQSLIDQHWQVEFDNTAMLNEFEQHFSNTVMVNHYLNVYQYQQN